MLGTSENPISFLRLPQVKQRVGLSRSSIYARVAVGEFPAPVRLGARSIGWIDSEIAKWIGDRVNASRDGAQTALDGLLKEVRAGRR